MKNDEYMKAKLDHAQFPQPRVGGVILEDKDEEKEDLIEGEAKLFAIIVDTQDIILETALILCQHSHIVKNCIILWKSFHNLILSGR